MGRGLWLLIFALAAFVGLAPFVASPQGEESTSTAASFFHGAGAPGVGCGGPCPCYATGRDRYINTTNGEEWYCSNAATDAWTLTSGSGGGGDALHLSGVGDPATACSGSPCDCVTAGKDRYVNLSTSEEYYCTNATTNTWTKFDLAVDEFILGVGETPAEGSIPAYGTTNATDMQVGNCQFNAALDAISCDQGAVGQASCFMEAVGNGTDQGCLSAPDDLDVSRNFQLGPTTGAFPADTLEDTARYCATRQRHTLTLTVGTAPDTMITNAQDLQIGPSRVTIPPFSRDVEVIDIYSWCVGTVNVDDTDDCPTVGSTVLYSCPTPAANVDYPNNCTGEATVSGSTEFALGGTMSLSSDGIIEAGKWMVLSLANNAVNSTRTTCAVFRTVDP